MLSPFAVKLQQTFFPKAGIGRLTGELFFWSTVGSIAGSLLSGFYLIPTFGTLSIMRGVAYVLVSLGAIGMMFSRFKKRFFPLFLFPLFFLLEYGVLWESVRPGVLYERDGIYERLRVFESEHSGKQTRYFLQDRTLSSAIDVQTGELVYDYTKYYDVYKLFSPDVKHVLVLGGGVYTMPAAYLKSLPQAEVDVSEIEPGLLDLGKQYFLVTDSPRLHNHIGDGRRFLHDSTKRYDLIFSDVYNSFYSIPAHFTTQEFFQLAKNKLNPEGIVIVNMIGSLAPVTPSFSLSEIRTFQSIFPNMYLLAAESPLSTDLQNIILVGYNSDRRIEMGVEDTKLLSTLSVPNIREKWVDVGSLRLENYTLLTDDYAPVEHLSARMVQKK